jgi:hypothetical protein
MAQMKVMVDWVNNQLSTEFPEAKVKDLSKSFQDGYNLFKILY